MIIDVSKAIFDTTVLVKGLVPPRRKKKDAWYEEQLKIHLIASSLLKKVEQREIHLIIPSIALIEMATVISRLTNDTYAAERAVQLVRRLAQKVVYDYEFLEKAITVGIETRTSGFDVVFLTCSRLFNLPLITDDQKLCRIMKEKGYNVVSLRDLTEETAKT